MMYYYMFQNKLFFRRERQFATRGRQIASLQWQIAILAKINVGTRWAVTRGVEGLITLSLLRTSMEIDDPSRSRLSTVLRSSTRPPSKQRRGPRDVSESCRCFRPCTSTLRAAFERVLERPSSMSSIFEVVSSFRCSIHSIVVRPSFGQSFLTILSIK